MVNKMFEKLLPKRDDRDMKILCIDTSGDFCSALLVENGAVVNCVSEQIKWGHAAALHPIIFKALDRTTFDMLDAFAVNVGPGGFTGIRVGLAAARGFGLASGKPVIGVDGFDLLFATVKSQLSEKPVALVMESRRVEKYIKVFTPDGKVIRDAFCALPEDVDFGGMDVFTNCDLDDITLKSAQIDLNVFPDLVATKLVQPDRYIAAPLYIRPPDVSKPKS